MQTEVAGVTWSPPPAPGEAGIEEFEGKLDRVECCLEQGSYSFLAAWSLLFLGWLTGMRLSRFWGAGPGRRKNPDPAHRGIVLLKEALS
jgi:hypothetical protein